MTRFPICPVLALVLAGCAGMHEEPPVIASTKSPVELRAMQSRVFDTSDRTRTVRAVIYTLQDLGYNIDKVDAGSGTVSATKLAQLRLSAAVSPRGNRMSVRANAQVKVGPQRNEVDSAEFYRTLFFAPLSAAMFLEATSNDDQGPAQASNAHPAAGPASAGPPQS